jgi:putative aminopeptidase FrvX
MTLFLWVFLTPFLLVGVAIIAGMAMTLAGQTRVTLTREEGKIFSGIGSIGWTRRFDITQVKRVIHEDKTWTDSDGDKRQKASIIIDAEKRISFASELTAERRKFVAGRMAAHFA